MMNERNKASEWLTRYGDYLFSLAMMKTGNRETAEDLVQETFLSAIRTHENFENRSSEKTWLVSILKNKIIDYYRRKDVLSQTSAYLETTEDSFASSFFDMDEGGHWKKDAYPGNWITEADTSLNSRELQRIIDFCISKLPSKVAPVFIARFIEEENSDTICKDFGISSSNYWVMIHRAKILMRTCLEKNWLKG